MFAIVNFLINIKQSQRLFFLPSASNVQFADVFSKWNVVIQGEGEADRQSKALKSQFAIDLLNSVGFGPFGLFNLLFKQKADTHKSNKLYYIERSRMSELQSIALAV